MQLITSDESCDTVSAIRKISLLQTEAAELLNDLITWVEDLENQVKAMPILSLQTSPNEIKSFDQEEAPPILKTLFLPSDENKLAVDENVKFKSNSTTQYSHMLQYFVSQQNHKHVVINHTMESQKETNAQQINHSATSHEKDDVQRVSPAIVEPFNKSPNKDVESCSINSPKSTDQCSNVMDGARDEASRLMSQIQLKPVNALARLFSSQTADPLKSPLTTFSMANKIPNQLQTSSTMPTSMIPSLIPLVVPVLPQQHAIFSPIRLFPPISPISEHSQILRSHPIKTSATSATGPLFAYAVPNWLSANCNASVKPQHAQQFAFTNPHHHPVTTNPINMLPMSPHMVQPIVSLAIPLRMNSVETSVSQSTMSLQTPKPEQVASNGSDTSIRLTGPQTTLQALKRKLQENEASSAVCRSLSESMPTEDAKIRRTDSNELFAVKKETTCEPTSLESTKAALKTKISKRKLKATDSNEEMVEKQKPKRNWRWQDKTIKELEDIKASAPELFYWNGQKPLIHLFVIKMLRNAKCKTLIEWIEENDLIFKIKQPLVIARLWQLIKGNKHNNYECFARGIRHSRDIGGYFVAHEIHRKKIYKLTPKAIDDFRSSCLQEDPKLEVDGTHVDGVKSIKNDTILTTATAVADNQLTGLDLLLRAADFVD